MKKMLMLLLTMLFIPAGVKAMATSESFYVGNRVSVDITKSGVAPENGTSFYVLKDSGPDDSSVTLILDGILVGNTIYDMPIPADNHDAELVFDKSMAYQTLAKEIANRKWDAVIAGILTADDLTRLGITKNSAGIYEIPEKYSFLAPTKLADLPSDTYNYWTSITEGTDSVYCVTASNDNTNGVVATLDLKNINTITNGPKCGIRPVVVVEKQYILCNYSVTPTSTTEKPTTPSENVKTGVEDYLLPLVSIILIAGITIGVTKKKEVFQDI